MEVKKEYNKNKIHADRIYVFKSGTDEGFVFQDNTPLDNSTPGIFYTTEADEITWDDDINGEKIIPPTSYDASLTFTREIKFPNQNFNAYTIIVKENLFKDLNEQLENQDNNELIRIDFHNPIIEYRKNDDNLFKNNNAELKEMLNEEISPSNDLKKQPRKI